MAALGPGSVTVRRRDASGLPAAVNGAVGGGAVLRGVEIHADRRTLRRSADSGATSARDGAEPVRAIAGAPQVSPYDEGYRAGHAAAEAALRAAHDQALEQGYRAALAKGHEEGRQHGLAEGRKAGEETAAREARAAADVVAERLARLDGLLSGIPRAIEARLAMVGDDMVALCHGVICRILGNGITTRDGVAAAVRQAIADATGTASPAATGRSTLAVHLHPRDLQLLRGDNGAPVLGEAMSVEWVADEGVGLGGCIVRSDEGSLDARLETQLAELRAALLRGLRGVTAAGAGAEGLEPEQEGALPEGQRR